MTACKIVSCINFFENIGIIINYRGHKPKVGEWLNKFLNWIEIHIHENHNLLKYNRTFLSAIMIKNVFLIEQFLAASSLGASF